MTRVTIEGSVTPSVNLPRGQRTTVEMTPTIAKMVERGFVNIIAVEPDPQPAPVTETEPEPEPAPRRRARSKPVTDE